MGFNSKSSPNSAKVNRMSEIVQIGFKIFCLEFKKLEKLNLGGRVYEKNYSLELCIDILKM